MTFLANKPDETVRVVVIEDNDDDRDLLLRQLRKSKTDEHVKFMNDGKTALDYLSHLPPAAPFCELLAVFLDLNLPSVSGLEILRRLRRMARYKTLPVIVMTSSIDPKDFEECQRLNVAAFVSKPVTFESFSRAITSLSPLAR